jgi:hypothetical protein
VEPELVADRASKLGEFGLDQVELFISRASEDWFH